MALKKLPLDLQSKFRASAQIRSFKTAVEELVYNALDANSSSIAVRVDVNENYIQVVDNGHGVAKDDFMILGERYTTSKFEKSTLSQPVQMYGYYGQSLANLIEVSQSVKITSKCANNEDTWMKHFCNGKEEACAIITERTSVGTTVEIKGFLYNLNIQKKAVKAIQELQNIKTFLEQIALTHCNTSISLRDNSLNEIIFQIHKNRDILKTLASVLNICTSSLQEFQVGKNEYKVTGFIQNNNEETRGYQWIYVNGRFINNSNLHKVVNGNLTKGVLTRRNVKSKSYTNENENSNVINTLPDYFIFIKCPKQHYDVVPNYKKSILEFKNVICINQLLDKLAKFYINDNNSVKVTETKMKPIVTLEHKTHAIDTRNKIKQIMNKILGSRQKKINGSDLHNGVKGKITRRKIKKECGALVKAKLKLKECKSINKQKHKINDQDDHILTSKPSVNKEPVTAGLASTNNLVTKNKNPNNHHNENQPRVRNQFLNDANIHPNKEPRQKIEKVYCQKKRNKEEHVLMEMVPGKIYKHINKEKVLSKFEKESEVHERCNHLAKKVNNLLKVYRNRRCKIFSYGTVQYSNIITNKKSISVRKRINEIIIHEYVPLAKQIRAVKNHKIILKDIKKSTDLLRPVTNIIKYDNFEDNIMRRKIVEMQTDQNYPHVTKTHVCNIPGSTYESHGYLKDTEISRLNKDVFEKCKKKRFISKTSRDNLASPNTDRKVIKRQRETKDICNSKSNYLELRDVEETSYSIHFTKSASQMCQTQEISSNISNVQSAPTMEDTDKSCIGATYTIAHLDTPGSKNIKNLSSRTGIIETVNNHMANSSETSPNNQNTRNENAVTIEVLDKNVVFISNSQCADTRTNSIEPIEPIRMCEAVIGSSDDKQKYQESLENIFHSTNNVVEVNAELQARETIKEKSRRNFTRHKDDPINDCLIKNLYYKSGCVFDDVNYEPDNFNLKDRRRYIPKGMSPIFEPCNPKNVHFHNYKLDADYFEAAVYNNFAQNVQIHSEIYEPKIQNVKETVTRDIQRVDIKLNKDNAFLTFNAASLQNAKVLGQIDSKFIATILSAGCNDCLVLFDQHAVHERIRLEQNISDYISQDQWKSIPVDGFSLKLTREEILYMHNYRDKFERLGLQWCMASDTQVLVKAIPEAILGKHLRQVDVVLKAVNNLIKEEISIIKEQGGCVSLYPKSIMDLVFSEACRYAIMFGTALTVRECSSLIEALSHCRMPFQCAHGRPALAVLVDVLQEFRPYTVNIKKVAQFRK